MPSFFHKWLQNPTFAKLWQFAKFGIVGVSNTAISLLVYQVCIRLGVHYLAANLIGLVVSVVNAYYWNNRCVFGDGTKKPFRTHIIMYLKSLTAYGGAFVLDSLLLMLWVEVLHVSEAIAPVLNLCITIPLNFFINKYWTFGKRKG